MADLTKRMNYFDHQFLRAADFQDEQAYDLDRRRRHNRLLHAPGIAEGLQVSGNIGDAFVTVSPGTAYDALGREIVLAASEQVSVSTITGTTAYITIAYSEQASDPSTDPGVTGNSTRISEQPSLAASATPPANPNLVLPLTRIALASGEVSSVPDNTVRNQTGAVVAPDLVLHSVTLRNDTVAASTWPRLICSGANTAALQNAGLTFDDSQAVFFIDNGQIRSHDDSHRIVFNRQNNRLELHEAGDIVLMTGDAAPTEKLRVTASGNVGVGTATPDSHLTVQGSRGATYLTVKDTATTGGGPWEILMGVDAAGGIVSTMTNHDLQLRSGNNSTRMIVKNDGKVGVGTTSPAYLLDVAGRIRLRQGPGDNEANSAGLWLFHRAPNADQAFIGMAGDTSVGLFGSRAGFFGLAMDTTTGNVLVGNPKFPTGDRLDVAGAAHASSFPTSSDQRFKTNIAPLTDTLQKIDSIRGVAFDWNELHESLGRSTGRREIGVIAQEVEQVFPELVSTWQAEGYKAVDYGQLTAVLVEAIKELKQKNESLERRVETLEKSLGTTSRSHASPRRAGRGRKGK